MDLELTRPEQLLRRNEKLQALLGIAQKFGSERDLDRLFDHIVSEASRIIEADRCSMFVLDEERRELWTKIAHGVSREIRISIDRGIVGQCARTCQPILIEDAYSDSRFMQEIDKATGYRTRSLLAVPMLDLQGRCLGVLQALNKKTGAPFTLEDQELLFALGGQAAVALENSLLHEGIRKLFEGFVQASIVAIESRDPTTSGHSERVALLTVALATTVASSGLDRYKDVSFTSDQLKELRYASLLHDFGKVGVREEVLVKANKLYPHELETLRLRFDYVRKEREAILWRRLAETLRRPSEPPKEDELSWMQMAYEQEMREIDEFWQFIQAANRPTVLEQGGFERLQEISRTRYVDPRGESQLLLNPIEMQRLSIPRGSLDAKERLEIESHVTHTIGFLEKIPWTRDLARIPEIAGKHHEKLNGKGYPARAPGEEIPIQSRMMTISDIYDALTAQDRPYKKAVPYEKAIDILHMEAKQGSIDSGLLEVFVEANVPLLLRSDEKA